MSLYYTDKADTDTDTYNKAQAYSKEEKAKFKQILGDANLDKKVIDSEILLGINEENKTMRLKEQLEKLMENIDANNKNPSSGGKRKVNPDKPAMNGKKEILGKQRCIYKKAGDRKEYVKYKGVLITVKDYKKILLS